jgi:ATP-binding cassette subfamily C (CFTR/MRP) protein 1
MSWLSKHLTFECCSSIGRILSRLSKDQDTLDNELAGTLNQVGHLLIGMSVDCSVNLSKHLQFLTSFSSVIGTIGLVFYTFPYLGLIFVPLTLLYFFVSLYYRCSSVETKRLDSVMRSILYGSFSGMIIFIGLIRVDSMFYRNLDWTGDYQGVPKPGEKARSFEVTRVFTLY